VSTALAAFESAPRRLMDLEVLAAWIWDHPNAAAVA
jgi:hypothetical protein